jgi:hypothetical protein
MTRLLRVERAAALVWLAVAAFACSDAGIPYPLWMALVLWMVALAAWWILRALVAALSSRGTSEGWGSRLFVPAVVAAGLLFASTPVLLAIRVRASQQALVASAPMLARIPAGQLFHTGQPVGLFTVRGFEQPDGELRFLTSACGVVDLCGVVYAPSGTPSRRGRDAFRHLYGPWWHWYQTF